MNLYEHQKKALAETNDHKRNDKGQFVSGKNNENYKHGLYKTRLYGIWKNMKTRCYCKTYKLYEYYGKRGITVCDEWKNDFQSFYDWSMSNGYKDDLSIDRIDNEGNYDPSNCRWATKSEQAENRRNCIYISFHGKTQTISKWSKELGINRMTLKSRLDRGWDIEKAFTTIPASNKSVEGNRTI